MTREEQATRKMQRALATLLEGRSGVEQSKGVQAHLRALERAGLARFVRGGWYVTSDGERSFECTLATTTSRRSRRSSSWAT